MPLNPLPSFIRASAQDAATAQMRAANRTKWSKDDYDLACDTQDRLIASCYGRPGDNQPYMCFIRFSIAQRWQNAGKINIKSNWDEVLRQIEQEIIA